jgi:hypothetical protein
MNETEKIVTVIRIQQRPAITSGRAIPVSRGIPDLP